MQRWKGWIVLGAVVGLPRQGKTYALALKGMQAMARGKTVYATFALKGAGELKFLPDVLSEEFEDSVLLVHEMAALFDNRQWQKLDSLATTSLAQHGKGSITLWYDALSLAMVDLRIRQVTEQVIHVERVGNDGTMNIGRPASFYPPSIFLHPYGFKWHHYRMKWAGIMGDGMPQKVRIFPFGWEFVPWRREVAGSYSTTDKVIPGDLLEEISGFLETAKDRTVANTGAFDVKDGKVICRPQVPPLPDGVMTGGKRSKSKDSHGVRLA